MVLSEWRVERVLYYSILHVLLYQFVVNQLMDGSFRYIPITHDTYLTVLPPLEKLEKNPFPTLPLARKQRSVASWLAGWSSLLHVRNSGR